MTPMNYTNPENCWSVEEHNIVEFDHDLELKKLGWKSYKKKCVFVEGKKWWYLPTCAPATFRGAGKKCDHQGVCWIGKIPTKKKVPGGPANKCLEDYGLNDKTFIACLVRQQKPWVKKCPHEGVCWIKEDPVVPFVNGSSLGGWYVNHHICKHCGEHGDDDPDCSHCGQEMCVDLKQVFVPGEEEEEEE